MTIFRLIYASRISPVCQDGMKACLTDILSRSVTNNRKVGVTGLLLAYQGWFVQALEADQKGAVWRVFDKVAADARHHHAVPVIQGPADERLFGQWSMGARVLSAGDEAVLAALNPKAPFDPMRAPERTLMRLFEAVADVHWRTLGEQQSLAA